MILCPMGSTIKALEKKLFHFWGFFSFFLTIYSLISWEILSQSGTLAGYFFAPELFE